MSAFGAKTDRPLLAQIARKQTLHANGPKPRGAVPKPTVGFRPKSCLSDIGPNFAI